MNKTSISVVIRTHNINRIEYVRRAVQSIVVQQNVCVDLIVTTQGFSDEDIENLHRTLTQYTGIYSVISNLQIINVGDYGQENDLRVKLLNTGIAAAKERYIAFLDDDDIVYHFAYEKLISDIKLTKSAVAFGRCIRVEGIYNNGIFYAVNKTKPYKGASTLELIIDNFCPIHSYVMDRYCISSGDLIFDELSPILEDYRLLLRLISKYKFTFISMNEDICEYWFYSNKMNTTIQSRDPFSKSAHEWRRAYYITQSLKSSISIDLKMLDFELWARTRLLDLAESCYGHRGLFSGPTDASVDILIKNCEEMSVSKDIVFRGCSK